MCNGKPTWGKAHKREKIKTNRKFHTPVDHFTHTLECVHIPTPVKTAALNTDSCDALQGRAEHKRTPEIGCQILCVYTFFLE